MKENKKSLLFILIILMSTLVQVNTDLYTPSIPAIAHDLHTSLGMVQLTMSWFIFGVAISNLIYGPLSEGIGRKYTLVIGNLIALIGVLFCINAHNIQHLQFARFLQGLGLGASGALWRSIFRDTYSGKEMARIGSYVANAMILAGILAPFLGGIIQQYFAWHVVFEVLLLWLVAVTLIIAAFYYETNKETGKHRLKISFIFSAYKELLTSRLFLLVSLSVAISYGGLFAWFTAGPVILIHGVGISPLLYGSLMFFTAIATAIGSTTNAKLLKKYSTRQLLSLGWSLMFTSGVLLLLFISFFTLSVYIILIPAIIFSFAAGFIYPNALSFAFTPFGHIAGYAGSLYACIQLLGGVVFSAVLSHLNTSSAMPLATLFIFSGLLSIIVFYLAGTKKVTN